MGNILGLTQGLDSTFGHIIVGFLLDKWAVGPGFSTVRHSSSALAPLQRGLRYPHNDTVNQLETPSSVPVRVIQRESLGIYCVMEIAIRVFRLPSDRIYIWTGSLLRGINTTVLA